MLYLVAVLLSPVLIIALAKMIFHFQSPDALIKKYQGRTKPVTLKKYPEVDIQNFRSMFMNAGMAIALAFVLLAFNYKKYDKINTDYLGEIEAIDEIEQLPPPSVQKPPPPPPPPPPPKLEIVEDEEIIEDEPEIIETEALEETLVEPVEETLEEVVDKVVEEIIEEGVIEEDDIEEEEVEEPEIFTFVEEMPEYPGGQSAMFKFIGSNIAYPPMARENGIEGTVYVGFVVMEDGSIQNVHIKRGLPGGGAGCDVEALRVAQKMPKWKPGKQRGKPVRVAFTLPIKYKLQ